MCGIAGRFPEDASLVATMIDAIAHRGPDGRGIESDGDVTLGHARLAVIDRSPAGAQPMRSADGRYRISYNGEVYNFRELRQALTAEGATFRTGTDTEVVLEAFARWGTAAFTRFNGIFAFAVHDREARQLFLVRDWLGVKPLYYHWNGEALLFASEIKAIEAAAGSPLTLDALRAEEYLHDREIADEAFQTEIRSLPPGYWLQLGLEDRSLQLAPFATLEGAIRPARAAALRGMSDRRLADELDDLLQEVVRDQLVSDAPIGTICSGGLDSSLLTAIACRQRPDLQLFSVRVAHTACDESAHAELVARHLGVRLHQVTLDREGYLAWYGACTRSEDLPLVHASSVGIFLLSRLAREHGVSVLLSGEGADELFGGYHRYKAFRKRLLLEGLPLVRWLLGDAHRLFADPDLTRFDPADPLRTEGPRWLVNRQHHTRSFHEAFAFVANARERELKAFIAKDLRDYLPSILRRTDRMSMAVGLEMRVPYLDQRLVDFALHLPGPQLVSWRHGKILLRAVARRYLPEAIVDRAKMGFPLPVQEWLGAADVRRTFYDAWQQRHVVTT